MRARLFLTAAAVIAVVCRVSSQTGTADGVAALGRGDYQRAVEILKPIAEDWRTNDTAAQFFMAGLYEFDQECRASRQCRIRQRLRACHL